MATIVVLAAIGSATLMIIRSIFFVLTFTISNLWIWIICSDSQA